MPVHFSGKWLPLHTVSECPRNTGELQSHLLITFIVQQFSYVFTHVATCPCHVLCVYHRLLSLQEKLAKVGRLNFCGNFCENALEMFRFHRSLCKI